MMGEYMDAAEKAVRLIKWTAIGFFVLVATVVCSVAVFAAEQSVRIGGNFAAQGCPTPTGAESTRTVSLGYDLATVVDGRDVTVTAQVTDKPRGSDCTRQGLVVDIEATASQPLAGAWTVDMVAGYDEHGVTGFDSGDRLVFGSVSQATAAVMAGRDFSVFGGAVDVGAGWNVATSEPRIAASYRRGALSLAGDCTGAGAGAYCDAYAAWRMEAANGWGMEVRFEHSNGLEHLPDPFGGRADAPAAVEANTLLLSLTREIR